MATKFENSYLQKGCKDGALLKLLRTGTGPRVRWVGRIWHSPPIAHWYLSIRVEPLGGGHQQLPFHAVKCKGQDCPSLLGMRGTRWGTWNSLLRHNLSWSQRGGLLFTHVYQVYLFIYFFWVYIPPLPASLSNRSPCHIPPHGPDTGLQSTASCATGAAAPVPVTPRCLPSPCSALYPWGWKPANCITQIPLPVRFYQESGGRPGGRREHPGPHCSRSLGPITCHRRHGDGVGSGLQQPGQSQTVSVHLDLTAPVSPPVPSRSWLPASNLWVSSLLPFCSFSSSNMVITSSLH